MENRLQNIAVALTVLVLVVACSKSPDGVRVTNSVAAKPKAATAIAKARSEPVFYNGKIYHLDFVPQSAGNYGMQVKGMSDKQQKDAVAVATSSLRYFACPDGQTGVLTEQPQYQSRVWRMAARCG